MSTISMNNGNNQNSRKALGGESLNESNLGLVSDSGKLSRSILLWFLFVFSLLLNLGIALLPAIFFLNPAKEPHSSPLFTNGSNHTIMPPLNFPCNLPLKLNPETGLCDIPCTWTFFTPGQDVAQHIIDNISLTINLLGFVFVLLTWMSLKQLRVFPNVIPLYIQGTSSCVSLLILIGNGMKTKKAFCNHEFFKDSTDHPTQFCVVQGMLIQYFSNVTAMWFITYSVCLIQIVFYQNTIASHQSSKWKHAISAGFCYLLPWIPVGIVFANNGYGEVYGGRMCLPRNHNLIYYANTMITEIGLGTGCTFLIVVVFKLFRLRDIDTVDGPQSERRKSRLSKVAIRLVCLMFAFAICSSLVYIPICLSARDKNLLEYYLRSYVKCLMTAPSTFCTANKVDFENHTNAQALIASYLSSGLFAVSTVCFLAVNKHSRRLWSFWWKRLVNCCCLPDIDEEVN